MVDTGITIDCEHLVAPNLFSQIKFLPIPMYPHSLQNIWPQKNFRYTVCMCTYTCAWISSYKPKLTNLTLCALLKRVSIMLTSITHTKKQQIIFKAAPEMRFWFSGEWCTQLPAVRLWCWQLLGVQWPEDPAAHQGWGTLAVDPNQKYIDQYIWALGCRPFPRTADSILGVSNCWQWHVTRDRKPSSFKDTYSCAIVVYMLCLGV